MKTSAPVTTIAVSSMPTTSIGISARCRSSLTVGPVGLSAVEGSVSAMGQFPREIRSVRTGGSECGSRPRSQRDHAEVITLTALGEYAKH